MTLTALPAASAAPSPGPASQLTAGTAKAPVPDEIRCRINVHNPHYSHHGDFKGRNQVNVVADVKCGKPVAHLTIRVNLYKDGTLYKSSQRSNAGRAKISHNAARRCVKKKRYQGTAWADVVMPPGYLPPTQRIANKSEVVLIRQCKRS
ncbi:hypothetical protein FXF68_27635 [Actinomadura decatromicini]|uniref:Uncharacterized protein n=2 Tax=Actinomadura decatromicini TaxID=2604572 RepID=A0A5D3FGE2_9ACTN|nr:hypothetical protein FXF68_27635 [Actinomadura decatromicini]